MKILLTQTGEKALAQFGAEAVSLIQARNFSELAERFGYVLAYGRDTTQAIKEDFEHCLSEAEGASSQHSPSIYVKYFKPNSVSLYAVVGCITPISKTCTVLIELAVFGDGGEKNITLEDISCVV